jgi:pyruvate/2-oxoacid:ferredoxin oxidoreductase beta subunit
LDTGSENSQNFFEDLGEDCPHCGELGTLSFSSKEMEVNEKNGDTLLVEGLLCSECMQIFMSPNEGARYLNVKAKSEGSVLYYGVHDGEITETRLQ